MRRIPDYRQSWVTKKIAAENNGPMIFAEMGMMQAINRHRVKEVDTSRKTTHWGKRKLKREQ